LDRYPVNDVMSASLSTSRICNHYLRGRSLAGWVYSPKKRSTSVTEHVCQTTSNADLGDVFKHRHHWASLCVVDSICICLVLGPRQLGTTTASSAHDSVPSGSGSRQSPTFKKPHLIMFQV